MSTPQSSAAGRYLSSLGAKLGGQARQKQLTKEQRQELGRKGAAARWGPKVKPK